jgi:hypothetical protein
MVNAYQVFVPPSMLEPLDGQLDKPCCKDNESTKPEWLKRGNMIHLESDLESSLKQTSIMYKFLYINQMPGKDGSAKSFGSQ